MNNEEREQVLRARGWSIHTEGSIDMTHDEKAASLQSIPSSSPTSAKRPLNKEFTKLAASKRRKVDEKKSSALNTPASGNSSPLFPAGGTSNSSSPLFPTDATEKANGAAKQPPNHNNFMQVAKSRLSKWAARLFDPNRPRGLIESPQVIPLNDEFLKAFGNREKDHDKARGLELLEIDRQIQEGTDDEQEDAKLPATTPSKKKKSKVKIINLKFTTTGARLQKACEKFGPVEHVNLVMDNMKQGGQNKGRAYVTFVDTAGAEACLEGMKVLEGRNLSVTPATENPSFSAKNASSARYWIQDISTKCYRCGQVGHIEPDCKNAALAKPCPICAMTDHDLRACPYKAVCFNCGVPGHVVRDCRGPRGMPPRHLDEQAASRGSADAICMECHQRGHYLCRDFKWFFGLDGGLTCFNCGLRGHIGGRCDRPNMEVCSRYENVVEQEFARAATYPTEEDLATSAASRDNGQSRRNDDSKNSRRRSSGGNDSSRGRGGNRGRGSNESSSRGRAGNNDSSSRGRGNNDSSSRGRHNDDSSSRRQTKSVPPPQHRSSSSNANRKSRWG
jgi:cellular nucleic acid-binding protein